MLQEGVKRRSCSARRSLLPRGTDVLCRLRSVTLLGGWGTSVLSGRKDLDCRLKTLFGNLVQIAARLHVEV